MVEENLPSWLRVNLNFAELALITLPSLCVVLTQVQAFMVNVLRAATVAPFGSSVDSFEKLKAAAAAPANSSNTNMTATLFFTFAI